jgi:Rho GDP-dissociation inhibitor
MADDFAPETDPAFHAPRAVDMSTLRSLDASDEALNRWKSNLLGGGATGACCPASCVHHRYACVTMLVDGCRWRAPGGDPEALSRRRRAPDGRLGSHLCVRRAAARVARALTCRAGDLSTIKDYPFCIKEGCEYRLGVTFTVEGDIVSGLKYLQLVYRKGIKGGSVLV